MQYRWLGMLLIDGRSSKPYGDKCNLMTTSWNLKRSNKTNSYPSSSQIIAYNDMIQTEVDARHNSASKAHDTYTTSQ